MQDTAGRSVQDVRIYAPDEAAEAWQPQNIPYDQLLTRWYVVASTLPLWKNKKKCVLHSKSDTIKYLNSGYWEQRNDYLCAF